MQKNKNTSAGCYFKRKPKWVINEVIRLCTLMPRQGCCLVADTFNRLHEHKKEMAVSKNYVANKIKEQR